MSREIEKMAYEMTQYKGKVCERIEHNNCLLKFHTNAFINCNYCKLAEHLITEKGYRKANEVAREIFEQIEPCLLDYRNNYCSGLQLITFIRELKKKYTESEKDNGN